MLRRNGMNPVCVEQGGRRRAVCEAEVCACGPASWGHLLIQPGTALVQSESGVGDAGGDLCFRRANKIKDGGFSRSLG
jgi:hypothetical protein